MTSFFTRAVAALALGATALSAAPTFAAPPSDHGGYDRSHDDRHDQGRDRDNRDNRDRRDDRGQRDVRGDRHDRGRQESNRSNRYRPRDYDYNRPDPRYRGYYANRYYRGGYRPIPVTRSMRIYRGADDRYYCRRSDGTTGLIVGAALGGLVGNRLDRGESGVVGTLLGATTGALLGREIDRGSLSCR